MNQVVTYICEYRIACDGCGRCDSKRTQGDNPNAIYPDLPDGFVIVALPTRVVALCALCKSNTFLAIGKDFKIPLVPSVP